MRDKVLHWCQAQALLVPGQTVVCAVSGGADSVALLHLLRTLQPTLGLSLRAAHFNHQLRGTESDRDEAFVRRLCADWGVPLTVSGGDVAAYARQHGESLEEAARHLRYAFFASLGATVATAHTADDNLETMLLNLLRGTSLRGLSGIPPRRDFLIRPILCLTRQDVLSYLADNSIPHVEDSTNASDDCLRNRLRHHVVPLLRAENPSLAQTALRTAALLRQDDALLDDLAESLLREAELSPGPTTGHNAPTGNAPLFSTSTAKATIDKNSHTSSPGAISPPDENLHLSTSGTTPPLDEIPQLSPPGSIPPLDVNLHLSTSGATPPPDEIPHFSPPGTTPPLDEKKQGSLPGPHPPVEFSPPISDSAPQSCAALQRSYSCAVLQNAPLARRSRAARFLLKKCHIPDVSATHLAALDALMRTPSPSASVSLPGRWQARREYDQLYFTQQSEPLTFPPTPLFPGQTVHLPTIGLKIGCEFTKNFTKNCSGAYTFACRCDMIEPCGGLLVRPRAPGDSLRLPGGRKTLKKLLIDRKIPALRRGCIPVFADSHGLLAVWGIGVNLDRAPVEGAPAILLNIEQDQGLSEACQNI